MNVTNRRRIIQTPRLTIVKRLDKVKKDFFFEGVESVRKQSDSGRTTIVTAAMNRIEKNGMLCEKWKEIFNCKSLEGDLEGGRGFATSR